MLDAATTALYDAEFSLCILAQRQGAKPTDLIRVAQDHWSIPILKRVADVDAGAHPIPEMGRQELAYYNALSEPQKEAYKNLTQSLDALFQNDAWHKDTPWKLAEMVDKWKWAALGLLVAVPMRSYLVGQMLASEHTGEPMARPLHADDKEIVEHLESVSQSEVERAFDYLKGAIRIASLTGIRQGDSPSAMSARLKSAFRDFKSQLGLVAVTETSRANSAGQLQEYLDQGYTRVIGDSTRDSLACQHCASLIHGKVHRIADVAFASNYGAKASEYEPCVPLHPSCRCGWKPDLTSRKTTKAFGAFDASKHPRGKPRNRGQFASKPGGGGGTSQHTQAPSVQAAAEPTQPTMQMTPAPAVSPMQATAVADQATGLADLLHQSASPFTKEPRWNYIEGTPQQQAAMQQMHTGVINRELKASPYMPKKLPLFEIVDFSNIGDIRKILTNEGFQPLTPQGAQILSLIGRGPDAITMSYTGHMYLNRSGAMMQMHLGTSRLKPAGLTYVGAKLLAGKPYNADETFHEMGHLLMANVGLLAEDTKHPEQQELVTLWNGVWDPSPDGMFARNRKALVNVSLYASQDPAEALAESYVAYRSGDADKVPPDYRAVFERLKVKPGEIQ